MIDRQTLRQHGERIRQLRERLTPHVTQGEIARRLKVSLQKVKNWETGRTGVGGKDADRLAAFLLVPVADLFASPSTPISQTRVKRAKESKARKQAKQGKRRGRVGRFLQGSFATNYDAVVARITSKKPPSAGWQYAPLPICECAHLFALI